MRNGRIFTLAALLGGIVLVPYVATRTHAQESPAHGPDEPRARYFENEPIVPAQSTSAAATTNASAPLRYFDNEPVAGNFDPHDLTGVWRSYAPPAFARIRPEGTDFGMTTDNDNLNPEPPLT